MKTKKSILVSLLCWMAIVEFLIMIAFERFPPLSALVGKNVFIGPIIDTALLSIFVYIICLFLLKKPLDKMVEAVNEVANGNAEKKVEHVSNDEFGDLSHAFNRMAANLNDSIQKERELTVAALMTTVSERKKSEELAATNKKLQLANNKLEQANEETRIAAEKLGKANEEAQRAKQELIKSIEQLSKFNEISVGREMRMKELKAEMIFLREELGREPK